MNAQETIEQLQARGHLVTLDGRTDVAGAAALLGVAEKTLRNWRSVGRGPLPLKVAGKVSYRISALLEFIERDSAGYIGNVRVIAPA